MTWMGGLKVSRECFDRVGRGEGGWVRERGRERKKEVGGEGKECARRKGRVNDIVKMITYCSRKPVVIGLV